MKEPSEKFGKRKATGETVFADENCWNKIESTNLIGQITFVHTGHVGLAHAAS